jgi:hypothetical protein
MLSNVRRGDRGSIPLALLVIIAIGGLMTMLLGRVVTESRATAHNDDDTVALHAAEVGLEEAMFRLNNGLITVQNPPTSPGTGSVNGYNYTWQVAHDGSSWRVESSARRATGGVTRTVVARAQDRPLFDLVLATHVGVSGNGNNVVDSYDSSVPMRMPIRNTSSFGIVASNGVVAMNANGDSSSYADRVRLHSWTASQTLAQRCTPSSNGTCSGRSFQIEEPLNIRVSEALAQELRTRCLNTTGFTPWTASTSMTPTAGNNVTVPITTHPVSFTYASEDGPMPVRCMTNMNIDRSVSAPSIAGSPGNIVVVRDHVTMNPQGGGNVNCAGCPNNDYPSSPTDYPRARNLQIFTLSNQGPASNNGYTVLFRGVNFGGTIYAPNGLCGSTTGGIQVFGSIICDDLQKGGNWGFHYDMDLARGLTTGEYRVDSWAEE